MALDSATKPAKLDADNPWPGLAWFGESAAAFFNGRQREVSELKRLLLQAPLTVLFGRSGLGKTSLLKVLRGKTANLQEKETPGITVLPLEVPCGRGKVRAHAWDFASRGLGTPTAATPQTSTPTASSTPMSSSPILSSVRARSSRRRSRTRST